MADDHDRPNDERHRWRVDPDHRPDLAELDPHGNDGAPGDKDETRALTSTGDAEIDALFAEIDELLFEMGRSNERLLALAHEMRDVSAELEEWSC